MKSKRLTMVLALVAIATGAMAQVTNYASDLREVHVAVGLLDANKSGALAVPANPAPFVWYNLDQNLLAKPSGWGLDNPYAPTTVDNAILARWTALGAPTLPTVGDRIDKNNAAYWEVQISQMTTSELASYDAICVPVYTYLSLTSRERELLRGFVDQGGLLWIDVQSTVASAQDGLNGFPVTFTVGTGSPDGSISANFTSPLLNYPHRMDAGALAALLGESTGDIEAYSPAASPAEGLTQPIRADYMFLDSIVGDGGGAAIVEARVGAGHVLVTARATAEALNQVIQPGGVDPNNGYYAAKPLYDRMANAAARLVVNALYRSASHAEVAANSRQTGSIAGSVDAPMLQRFHTGAADAAATGDYAPSLFHGLLVAVHGTTISVYDANPGSDLDGDGNPDDGVVDYALGVNVDKLWSFNVSTVSGATAISPPMCLEADQPAANVPKDQIVVTDDTGKLYAFDAFNKSGGIIQPTCSGPAYTLSPAIAANVTNIHPLAPTYADGLLFVADNVGGHGRIWLADPANAVIVAHASGQWSVGGSSDMGEVSSSPTVGDVPNPTGDGLDRVVYVPTLPSADATAGVTGLWLGVKGESVSDYDVEAGNVLQLRTRAYRQSVDIYQPLDPTVPDPLGLHLTVLKSTYPYVMTQAEMDAQFPSGWSQTAGQVTIPMSGPLPADVTGFRIDYTIDWAAYSAQINKVTRGNLFFPDDSNHMRRVLGPVALGPDGCAYVITSSGDPAFPGGDYWAFKENGVGTYQLLTRYSLYDQHSISTAQGLSAKYRELFVDNDGITNFSPFLQGAITKLTFVGGPTVRGDAVYALAVGQKGLVPVSVIMAFKAKPEAPVVPVSGVTGAFSLVQPDISMSADRSAPSSYDQLLSTQVEYETQNGLSPSVRFDSLMSSTTGKVQDALSQSQPVILRRNGASDLLIEPDKEPGGKWSPLLWYSVIDAYRPYGAPFVSGQTLLFGGSSLMPNILTYGTLNPVGLLFGMSTAQTNSLYQVADSSRPWQVQTTEVLFNGINDISMNPSILWPQAATSVESFRQRLVQTTIGANPALGVVGGNGVLAAYGVDGEFAFAKTDFLICDNGRVLRVDSSGNPVWSAEASVRTTNDQDVGNVAVSAEVARPRRAIALGDQEILVVDAGDNWIVRLDASGRQVRTIKNIRLDSHYVPEGYQAGETLKFSEPSDVSVYSDYVPLASNPMNAASALEYWTHYIIADSGNHRIIELVDRYHADPATYNVGAPIQIDDTPQLGVLYWHSPSAFDKKGFDFDSVSRLYVPGVTPRYVVAAGVGSTLPTPAGTGIGTPGPGTQTTSRTGNGGIVVFDGANSRVINDFIVPDIPTDVFWDDSSSAFTSGAVATHKQKIGDLQSVQLERVPDGAGGVKLAILFADSSGVYEVEEVTPGDPNTDWAVVWMAPAEVYRFMRGVNDVYAAPGGEGAPDATNPLGLRANYAFRLPGPAYAAWDGAVSYTAGQKVAYAGANWEALADNSGITPTPGVTWALLPNEGEVLIVNGFNGRTRGNNSFEGEVVELNGESDYTGLSTVAGFSVLKKNFGLGTNSVRFALPPIRGARGLRSPAYAGRM